MNVNMTKTEELREKMQTDRKKSIMRLITARRYGLIVKEIDEK